MTRLPPLTIALCATLAACQITTAEPARSSLPGTSWELVAIRPAGDAQAAVQSARPARFTLRFGPDRRVVLRLDCNRGIGSWRAAPSSASAGALSFSQIAVTRALCQPPQLDERVARELAHVRSYEIRDGRLLLSPTADGGTLEWRSRREP